MINEGYESRYSALVDPANDRDKIVDVRPKGVILGFSLRILLPEIGLVENSGLQSSLHQMRENKTSPSTSNNINLSNH